MIGQKQRQMLLSKLRKLKVYIECLEEFKKDTQRRIKKIEECLK